MIKLDARKVWAEGIQIKTMIWWYDMIIVHYKLDRVMYTIKCSLFFFFTFLNWRTWFVKVNIFVSPWAAICSAHTKSQLVGLNLIDTKVVNCQIMQGAKAHVFQLSAFNGFIFFKPYIELVSLARVSRFYVSPNSFYSIPICIFSFILWNMKWNEV